MLAKNRPHPVMSGDVTEGFSGMGVRVAKPLFVFPLAWRGG